MPVYSSRRAFRLNQRAMSVFLAPACPEVCCSNETGSCAPEMTGCFFLQPPRKLHWGCVFCFT